MPRVETEVINDLNPNVAAMWRSVRDRSDDLLSELRRLDYSRATFEQYRHSQPTDEIDRAVRQIVVARMSRKSFAWSERLRGGRR